MLDPALTQGRRLETAACRSADVALLQTNISESKAAQIWALTSFVAFGWSSSKSGNTSRGLLEG